MPEQSTSATLDCLNGERSAELEFPITTWNQAPQLKLKTRLMQSTNEGSSSTLTILGQNGDRRIRTQAMQTNGNNQVEIPQNHCALTRRRSDC